MSGSTSRPFYEGIIPSTWLALEIAQRIVLFGIIGFLHLFVSPFKRRIQPEKWYKYRFPYAVRETFPVFWSGVVLLLAPCVNLAIMLYLVRERKKTRTLYRMSAIFTLGLSLSIGIAMFLCEIIKRFYGGLRPDFLARCTGINDSLMLIKIAQSIQTDLPLSCKASPYSRSVIKDGRMSFPSEHSALAFAVFTYAALFDFKQVKSVGAYGAHVLILPILILMFPLLIAVSRTSDYRHHPMDVVVGIFIGGLSAALVFFHSVRPPTIVSELKNPGEADPNTLTFEPAYGADPSIPDQSKE